jgi:hypothetical protein
MKPKLDVPDDLAHLIEKREKEDRRGSASSEGKGAGKSGARPAVERRRRNRRKS